MPDVIVNETSRSTLTEPFKKISWGAVFAGVVVVLATQMFLDLIGLAIGAGTVNPMKQASPLQGIGVGAVIWFAVSTILSVFAGGWVAGRLSGLNRVLETTMHGVVTWGLASLAALYMVTTAAGSVFSGVTGIIGRSIALTAQVAATAGAGVAKTGAEAVSDSGILSSLRNQALTLLRPTGGTPGPEAAPQDASGMSQVEGLDTGVSPRVAATPVGNAELSSLLDHFFNRSGAEPMSADDKAMAVNVLVMRGNLNPTDAQRVVEQWDQMYLQGRARVEEAKAQAAVQAREAGKQAASAISKTAAWSAVIMALGALAGAFGGFEAVSRDVRLSTLHRRRRLETASARV